MESIIIIWTIQPLKGRPFDQKLSWGK